MFASLSEPGTLKPPKPATYHSAYAEPGKPTKSSKHDEAEAGCH